VDELAAKIESEIRNRGPIPFARFMELALYCPVYGYYEKEGDIIGRRGDYYTSVSVGELFGQLLAWQFCDWFARAAQGAGAAGLAVPPRLRTALQIIEAGAHDGALAKDILEWFRQWRPALFEHLDYCILEPSAVRRRWQQKTLAAFPEHTRWASDFSKVHPGSTSQPAFRIIFANELLEAMPVHRLGWDAPRRAWFEWGVTIRDGRFAWIRLPEEETHGPGLKKKSPSDATSPIQILQRLFQALQNSELTATGVDYVSSTARLLELLPDGFTVEVSSVAEAWWRAAAACLESGKLVTIDYGHRFEEWLSPKRGAGTLRAYRQHHPAREVLDSPGHQDITADVNFTVLEQAGESAGLRTELLVSQSQFLTDIARRIWNGQSEFGPWTAASNRQFQTLTHAEHLGRAFKVIIQSRPTD